MSIDLVDMQIGILLPDVTGGYRPEGVYLILRKGISASDVSDLLAGALVVTTSDTVTTAVPHVAYLEHTHRAIQAITKKNNPEKNPSGTVNPSTEDTGPL